MTWRLIKLQILVGLFTLGSCASGPDGLAPLRDVRPDPELSPQEVVEIQLRAFGNNNATDEGIEIAFRFASPSNRAQTGPLERFAAMLKAPAYAVMLDHDRAEFAPLAMREGVAVQRVALYADDAVVVYDFYLRRQVMSPYEECWMTEGVFVRAAGQENGTDLTVSF